ncbi:MAG: hypothetical protein ACXVR1_00735 [Solirubrobacteraceae bacterium]
MSELKAFYDRYKSLALAIGADLLLEGEAGAAGLATETLHLAADAGRRRETDASPAAAAAHRAALDLHRLATAQRGETELIDQVRASHRALRAELWDDVCNQYAPCGTHPHRHTEEHDHV